MATWLADVTARAVVLVLIVHTSLAASPTLTPFSAPYNLHEDTTVETQMSQVVCTDPDAGDSCICNLQSTNPTNGPFQVWKKNGQVDFYVYYVGAAASVSTLNFQTTPSYQVVVACTDTTGSTAVTATLEVDILPNQSPVFTNTGAPNVALSLNAKTPYPADSTIYTVTASDAESDTLTFSITSSPDVSYFTIGASDGIIKTAIDLRAASESIITLTVSVTDGKNTATGFDIVITLTNMNGAPQIVNLPATISISETTASGTILTTLTITDADIFVTTLTPTCTVTPVAQAYKFTVSNDQIRLASVTSGATLLDYELTTQYLITCVVNDGYRSSTGEILTVDIENVNEGPKFDEIAYYCDLTESNVGVSSCQLNAVITDPEGDSIQSVGFVAGNNSERFRYDISTSTVTFNVDYDVDNSNMPTSVTLQLSAVDSNGASTRAPVYITIADANDNTCDFGATSTIQKSADQSTTLGNIGTLIATDADLRSPNNDVSYMVVSAIPADSTNYIAAYSDGRIEYIGLVPESNHGTTYSLTVRCKDNGSPQRTADATVLLTYETTTSTTTTTTTTTATTTTTTQASNDPFDNSGFVAVFAILMILLGLALLAGIYFCLQGAGACGGPSVGGSSGGFFQRCCMPRDKPQMNHVQPYKPEPYHINDRYKDTSWRNGDGFEDGRYLGSRGSITNIYGNQRALPAPKHYNNF